MNRVRVYRTHIKKPVKIINKKTQNDTVKLKLPGSEFIARTNV